MNALKTKKEKLLKLKKKADKDLKDYGDAFYPISAAIRKFIREMMDYNAELERRLSK